MAPEKFLNAVAQNAFDVSANSLLKIVLDGHFQLISLLPERLFLSMAVGEMWMLHSSEIV